MCTGNVESKLSAPVGMHPSRIMDIVRSSFLHGIIIGYDCLYLSRNVSHICLALNLRFQQTLHTKHDFCALKRRLIGKFSSFKFHGTPLVTFFCNCTGICSMHWQFASASRFRLTLNLPVRIPLFKNSVRDCFLSLSAVVRSSDHKALFQKKHPGHWHGRQTTYNLGGSASRLFEFSLICDHLTSERSLISQKSMFLFVAHVDDVGLLVYSSSDFVHTNIPLKELFKFLPLSHAQKIASVHCSCSKAELLIHVENHSCMQCSSCSTVFSVDKNNDQLNCKRVLECRE